MNNKSNILKFVFIALGLIILYNVLDGIFGRLISLLIVFAVIVFVFKYNTAQKRHEFVRDANKYIVHGRKSANTILRRLPSYIWGAFAVLGILAFGVMLGYEIAVNPSFSEQTAEERLTDENKKLYDLISGYEKLSDLYSLQGENVRIVFDEDLLYNHPEEVAEAFGSIEQFRNEILVQHGRVLELRKSLGYPEEQERIYSN